MKDLLDNADPDALVSVKVTGTVPFRGAYHGPNSVLKVPADQARAWRDEGLAVAAKASTKKDAGSNTPAPDLTDPAVRATVIAAMRALPKDAPHFTTTGKPEIKAVAEAVEKTLPGLKMTAAERDDLWDEAQTEADGHNAGAGAE